MWKLVACVLFAIHPVHTENIIYCVGFADTLSTIFMACAFLTSRPGSSRLTPLLFCLLSSLSKESGFVSFALILLVRFLRDPRNFSSYKYELLLTPILPALRYWYVGGSPVNFAYADVPYIYERESFVRGLSYLHVHSIYGRLLVLPWNMSWDYSFDAVPLIRTIYDMRILGSLATYLAVSALGYMSLQKRISGILSYSLFVLPFLPASSLFLSVGTVVGERLLYPVSFGLVAVLAVHASSSRYQKFLLRLSVVLIGTFSWLSWSRITVWSSKLSLYSTDAKAWPRSCKTLHQYGAVLMNTGPEGLDAALPVLQRSLSIFDDNALTDYLISQIYIEKGDLDSAISVHNKIAAGHGIGFTDFSRFMFLVDAGYALVADGRYGYEYPAGLIEEGLEIFGYVSHARNALGVAYIHQGLLEKAIHHLEFAAMIEEGTVSVRSEAVWLNLAVAYALSGDDDKAVDALTYSVEMGRSLRTNVSPAVVANIDWMNVRMPYGADVSAGRCVKFDEHVQIFFFCDSAYTFRAGEVKQFDGRSRVERGRRLSTQDDLDEFAILSSVSSEVREGRRARSFGGRWDDVSDIMCDSESTRSDSDDEWMMLMENTPCDCDLVSTT